MSKAKIKVFSPPSLSETAPPPTRVNDARIEYRAVSRPAVTGATAKNDVQYVGEHAVKGMKSPQGVK